VTSQHKLAETGRQFFKVSAVIDWIDVEIRTSRTTQHRYIRAALREITGIAKWWAGAVDVQQGNNANTYRIRFRDELANSYQQLCDALTALARRYPFTTEPVITGIEISCDWWHKQQSVEATRAMTYRLQTRLHVAGTQQRQYDPEAGDNRYLNKLARINPELGLRIGSKKDDVSYQVYFKRTDNKQPLPVRQWRARVEVTLQNDALQQHGLALLSELPSFNFQKLCTLFRFKMVKPAGTLAGANLLRLTAINTTRKEADATAERGTHSFNNSGRRDKRGRLRANSKHLKADSELYSRVKDALKRLNVR